ANYGFRNPFFYHEWEDDFDGVNAIYTQTKTTGTIAALAGDGGQVKFTTAATASDLTSIQLPAASFSFTAGKKSFFLCRLQVDDATSAEFNVGLMETTATPFAPTDGLYFKKAAGAIALVLASMKGSAETDIVIPAAVNPLANATSIDLAWYVDRKQNVYAFVGSQLVGFVNQNTATIGPQASGTPVLTAANLAFTLAVGTAAATAHNMTVDFAMAAKER
ncbi:MAG: hypothetical protein ACRD22_19155, partial [Terriglobia bacterium]